MLKLKLSTEQRRALDLLAGSAAVGGTESLMLAHGFTRNVLAALILDGVANAEAERMMGGGKAVEVRSLKITAAGHVAMEQPSHGS